jgi:hypothetical protein
MATGAHRRLHIPRPIGSKKAESSLQLDLTVLREYVSQLHHHGKVRTLRQSVEVCSTCSGGCGLLSGNEPSAPRGCVAENRTDSADDKV